MSYIGNEPIVSATRTVTEVTATAGQTVFNANGGYTVGYLDVFLNGSKLTTTDFTATNGSSITLTEAAQVGDIVRLEAWGTFSTSNLVSPNYTGTLTGGTGVVNIGSGQVYKDASGNVGIGTSSPAVKLQVAGSIALTSANNLSWGGAYGAGIPTLTADGTNGFQFYPAGSTSGETMRINASGNVGIGTSIPTAQLTVASGNIDGWDNLTLRARATNTNGTVLDINSAGTGGIIKLSTNNTERMRLDSSGNLLVGTTSQLAGSASGTFHLVGGANSNTIGNTYLRNPNSSSGKYWNVGPVNNNGYVVYNQGGVGVYITDGGTSWTANSDERLKTALTPFENAVEKVSSLRAGTGRYLTDDESVSRSFLIAQDVKAVLPEAVDVQPDEQGTLGLRYQDLIPLLVAAIQEQQTIIQSQADTITAMEARLTALEGKQ